MKKNLLVKVLKFWLKCILRTSKGDLPYSPFHLPFLKGESPFLKGEWDSRKKIHPFKGWIFDKSDLKKGDWKVNEKSWKPGFKNEP